MDASQKRHLAYGGAAMLAVILLWLLWERMAKAENPRDAFDEMLINGAEMAGRPEAADRLRAAREDDNAWQAEEYAIVAIAIVCAALIAGYAGWAIAGPWGAVVGAIIGIAAGAIGAIVAITLQDDAERAAAEADIIFPGGGIILPESVGGEE